MRAFTIASFALLCLALGVQTAAAQLTAGNLPPEFFGAQRGRVVARPHGGFRLRYGRGLTPQGAEVISTAITTLGPLIPQIINPLATPMLAPIDPGAAADCDQPQCGPACEPLLADRILDTLLEPDEHAQRIARLDALSERMVQLVKSVGGKPVLPPPPPTQSGGGEGAVDVVGGEIIDRPASNLPAPAAAPSAATKDCAPTEN